MKSESLKWGQPLQGCRLSISMSSLRMESGSPIQLTLVFRNDGPFVIKVPRFSLWFDYEFKIRYNELHQISLTPFGQQQKDNSMMSATNVFELAPGQEMTSAVEISRLYDLRLPGKYVMEASRELPNPSGQGFIKVVSNSLEFEVFQTRQ